MFLFMVVIIRTVTFVLKICKRKMIIYQDVILRSYSALITQSFIKYSFIYLFVIPL